MEIGQILNFWNIICIYLTKLMGILKKMALEYNSETAPVIKVNHSRSEAGSNWKNALLVDKSDVVSKQNGNKVGARKSKIKVKENISRYVAMDCEMVGVGPEGRLNMVARVTIVDQQGEVLMDKYVKPYQKVTDYRTKYSGIRPHDIVNGENFHDVQKEVLSLLYNRILVGHSVDNDLNVLCIKHPLRYTRDTARYKPLSKLVSPGATPSLKRLTKAILNIDIQTGEHDSVEDARAAMNIYNRVSVDWEKFIKKHYSYRRK